MGGTAHRRRIGIIGGMGPEATVLLMSRIIAATPAGDDADHVPMIVDNNTQIPSRIAHLIDGRGVDPAPALVETARRLQACGAEALAMPCNTAHHFAAQIRRSVDVPLLDMVGLSAGRVLRQDVSRGQRAINDPTSREEAAGQQDTAGKAGGVRIGMLASPAVRVTGLYDRVFAGTGARALYLPDDAPLLALIRHVKKRGADAAARRTMAALARDLVDPAGDLRADRLLVACSELSLLAGAVPAGIAVIDAVDVLAEACVAFSTGAAVRPAPGRAA